MLCAFSRKRVFLAAAKLGNKSRSVSLWREFNRMKMERTRLEAEIARLKEGYRNIERESERLNKWGWQMKEVMDGNSREIEHTRAYVAILKDNFPAREHFKLLWQVDRQWVIKWFFTRPLFAWACGIFMGSLISQSIQKTYEALKKDSMEKSGLDNFGLDEPSGDVKEMD